MTKREREVSLSMTTGSELIRSHLRLMEISKGKIMP
jgi:hypothetical protein